MDAHRIERRPRRLTRICIGAVVPIVVVLIWQWATATEAWPTSLIAGPQQSLRDLSHLVASGELATHTWVSLKRLLMGFGLGSILGITLGCTVGLSRTIELLLAPTMRFLAPIPPIAWIPLLIVAFGIGEMSKVALIALAAFIVVYMHTVDGIRATSQDYVEVAHVFRKSKASLIFSVLLPSALSSIFTGLRLALGLSWILLISSELIASSQGLGWLVWDARRFARPGDMIAGMCAIGVLGYLSDLLLLTFSRRLLAWRRDFSGA